MIGWSIRLLKFALVLSTLGSILALLEKFGIEIPIELIIWVGYYFSFMIICLICFSVYGIIVKAKKTYWIVVSLNMLAIIIFLTLDYLR